MVKYLFAALLLFSTSANAYTKPQGAPEVFVPNHGVTVAIFAAQTAIGHGIGVFEYKPAQNDWTLCGTCFLAEYPTMDSAVDAAGGPGPYVESKRAAINAILASRYPAVSGPSTGSTIDRVNQALAAGSVLRLVDGSPQLGK